jgi:hypothetical protein
VPYDALLLHFLILKLLLSDNMMKIYPLYYSSSILADCIKNYPSFLHHSVVVPVCGLWLQFPPFGIFFSSMSPLESKRTLWNNCRELLHTKSRREEAYDKLESVLGESLTSCEIDATTDDMLSCLQACPSLTPSIMEQMFNTHLIEDQSVSTRGDNTISVTMDNSLSSVHTLIQIQCGDRKGLLYDIMRTVKDCNIQVTTIDTMLNFIRRISQSNKENNEEANSIFFGVRFPMADSMLVKIEGAT